MSLNIPDEARVAALLAYGTTPDTSYAASVRRALAAAVPLVLAAELDRLADEWEPSPLAPNVALTPGSLVDQNREKNETFARRLRARARELRGGA